MDVGVFTGVDMASEKRRRPAQEHGRKLSLDGQDPLVHRGKKSGKRPHPAPQDGELRDDEGLLLDAYVSDAFAESDTLDVMDVPDLLEVETILEEVPDAHDGIEEVTPPAPDVRHIASGEDDRRA